MSEPEPFFAGITRKDITIRGVKSRSPLFYRDAAMMLAIFTADPEAARSLLPDDGIRPLIIPPGRALLGINCFEYRDTDIGPYNEVALAIAVGEPGSRTAGLLAAGRSALRQTYHAYICDLPVNTEIALHGGLDFFNYPKYLADIRFEEADGIRTCRVLDGGSGEPIYSFEGDRLDTRSYRKSAGLGEGLDVCTFLSYPIFEGSMHRALFRVNQLERGTKRLHGGFRLQVGKHPRSAMLAALKPGRLLQYTYVPRAQAILYEPEPLA